MRTLSYSDVKRLDGREVPTRWEMKPADKPGKSTTIVIHSARYDLALDEQLFSLRELVKRN